ncbi:hypothetical protein PG999_013908 [Apiospora kogelbergensis]|uniref:Fungal N-terminal domain-containing protein n=1 Tax=Apiospora kogelbergensis TaxID=1337665 RepID=A0AAW0Q5R4_9PEZI
MAEAALGALGALSSILQIANSLVSSTRELRRSIKVAKGAPTEIHAFHNETIFLTTLIRTFHKLARDAPEPTKRKKLRERDILLAYVQQQCDMILDGVTELVNKFIDTHGAGGGNSSSVKVMTIWARVLWVIRRPDMEELKLSMNETKLNLSLLTNLFMWEEARRKSNNEDRMYV